MLLPINNAIDAAFIAEHRTDDVRRLALAKAPQGVDLPYCLTQIEGWQMARTKLSAWAEADGIVYPPRLSMEQCSSQLTGQYKASIPLAPFFSSSSADAQRSMADLTGGFGVDFSFLAPHFQQALYVERQEHLCEVALHNFQQLGLLHATVQCAEAEDVLPALPHLSLLYLDPARRDEAGRKVVALADCTPDVAALHDQLVAAADVVMIKLSPMLDIRQTLRDLPAVRQVHVVSVDGECKELLFLLSSTPVPLTYHCVNLGRRPQTLVVEADALTPAVIASEPGRYIYEPNASILKAGVQDVLCERLGVQKLHPFSHLFTSEERVPDFPGRCFQLQAWSGFGKKELRTLLSDVRQANLTVRNFPATVQQLRQRLRLSEGGDTYLFATTLADGQHVLLRCSHNTILP